DEAQQIVNSMPRRGKIIDKEVTNNSLTAPMTTYTEETTGVQVIIEEGETNGHAVIEASRLPAVGSVTLLPEHKTTSIERLTTAIKQHRLMVALAVLTVTVAAVIYFTRPGESIDSVAVMPFVNVSADPNVEYLSEGISDSIINNLSEVPSLKVSSFNSVLRYNGKQKDPQAIARHLNVRAFLVGRLTRHGDAISISSELIDAKDNRHPSGQQPN